MHVTAPVYTAMVPMPPMQLLGVHPHQCLPDANACLHCIAVSVTFKRVCGSGHSSHMVATATAITATEGTPSVHRGAWVT